MGEITTILAALIPSVGAVVGVYVNLTKEVEKMKGRIFSLENDRDELKLLMKECIDGIHELKVLIARKGLLDGISGLGYRSSTLLTSPVQAI